LKGIGQGTPTTLCIRSIMEKVVILGGDNRQIELYNILIKEGYDASLFGFDSIDKDTTNDIYGKLDECDYLFLPIPYKTNRGLIKMPFSKNTHTLHDIQAALREDCVVLLGKSDSESEYFLNLRNLKYWDFLKDENFLVENARLTAEAAIAISMLRITKSLNDCVVSILGYGRISKQLIRLLGVYECPIYVTTRRNMDSFSENLQGGEFIHTNRASEAVNKADVVFNTIPKVIFDDKKMSEIKQDVTIFELASYPYGFDMDYARAKGMDIRIEAGLPGRFFPKSAAMAIYESFKSFKNGE